MQGISFTLLVLICENDIAAVGTICNVFIYDAVFGRDSYPYNVPDNERMRYVLRVTVVRVVGSYEGREGTLSCLLLDPKVLLKHFLIRWLSHFWDFFKFGFLGSLS